MRMWRPSQKDRADHQEQHGLLGPRDRGRERVAADDVGEVDGDAQRQHGAGGDAQHGHQRVGASQEGLAHGRP